MVPPATDTRHRRRSHSLGSARDRTPKRTIASPIHLLVLVGMLTQGADGAFKCDSDRYADGMLLADTNAECDTAATRFNAAIPGENGAFRCELPLFPPSPGVAMLVDKTCSTGAAAIAKAVASKNTEPTIEEIDEDMEFEPVH